ncbi:cyclin-dependent kinase inhibitor 1-like [Triticum urartu]|uniref:Cyclin-dependent kinase inhibitor domain-containing protein n=1 Tax=Triticum urartu TaxID=4572 RepID=A0A8R7QUX7_TRIUA|nr:cyclin-dependent kinase inhibitor 1-like [Triticum urartu]
MGKYMRKCRAEDGAVGGVEVTQAVGVRTRSRAAAANVVVSKRRRPLPPGSPSASSSLARAQGGSCYLKLRSRMLFMAPPAPASGAAAGHGPAPPLPAGLSRCSSTASSVDASAAAQDRSLLSCGSDAAANNKAGAPEGSASNNAESGGNRERRETTPSSHFPGDLSDLESDLAGQNSGRSSLPQTPTAQAQPAARSRVPPAAEIEEFFAAAEEAEARRFACKYNFDVARGVPLDSGRYEWTPAVSSS